MGRCGAFGGPVYGGGCFGDSYGSDSCDSGFGSSYGDQAYGAAYNDVAVKRREVYYEKEDCFSSAGGAAYGASNFGNAGGWNRGSSVYGNRGGCGGGFRGGYWGPGYRRW